MSSTPQAQEATALAPPSSARNNIHTVLDALATKWRIVPVLLSLVIIWLIFDSQNSLFLSARNLTNLAEQIATTSILALGLVLVLLVGEIDLSVAALSAVCGGIVGVLVANHGMGLTVSMIAAIAAGGLFGLVQGSVIMFFNAPSFIITLGTSLILQAVLLILLPASGLVALAGTPVESIAQNYVPITLSYVLAALPGAIILFLGVRTHQNRVRLQLASSLPRTCTTAGAILVVSLAVTGVFNSYRGVPVPVAILAGLLVAGAYVTTQTTFGTYLFAVGGNLEASRRAGIPVRGIKIATFTILGMLTALAGVIAASRVLGVSASSDDPTLLLEAIAAAVIGGTSLFGGRGTVWSALVGALVIGSIANGMLLINASTQIRLLAEGGVLILAVIVDALIARSRSTATR